MSGWHVLVVDDDREIGALLQSFLQANALAVSVVPDGAAMIRALEAQPVDLIVLDIMLPGEDGVSLCRQLRQTGSMPIILLSARGDDVDRIIGMEAGADDYMAKPFHPRELLARIHAVLRRAGVRPAAELVGKEEILRFAGWSLNLTARTLIDPDGRAVELSGREFELLRALVEHPNQIMSRDRLMAATRGRRLEAFERTIDIHLSRVRRKLGDTPPRPSLIKTVRNGGYVLSTSVERCLVPSDAQA